MLNRSQQLAVQQLISSTTKNYKQKLRANNSYIYAINLVNDLHGRMDTIVSNVKAKGVRFGCERGCSHCCNLRVEALAPEIFFIAKKLKQERKKDELDELKKVLNSFSEKASGLTAIEHLLPCPMLSDGKCSIYNYRPMMCRKYNSLDADICVDPYAKVPENIEVVMKSSAIGHAFNAALSHKRLSANPHELGQALLLALSDESAELRWANGEQVFELIPEMQ